MKAVLSYLHRGGLFKSLRSGLIIPPHSDLVSNGSVYVALISCSLVLKLSVEANRCESLPFSVDEDWFTLDANLLRQALEITPIDQDHQFESPLLGDAIMDFVNQLGHPGEIHFVSKMAVNNLYQPWRAILSMIKQCLTRKTSGFDRPRYPFRANLGSATKKGKKTKPHVIPYCRFIKLIIYYLGRHHNIYQRSWSPLNLAEDDLRFGNLKFVPKGKIDEVFGMQIPKELITDNIRNAPYYNAYLEMVAKHERKITAEKKGDESRIVSGTGSSTCWLCGYSRTCSKATRPLRMVEGKGKAIATKEQAAQSLLTLNTLKRRSATDQFIFQRQTLATEEASTGPSTQPHDDTSANIVCETPFPINAKTGVNTNKAGSDPSKTLESRPPLDDDKMDEDQAGSDPGKSHVALARPNPEPMHDDFMAIVYPKVHESLKFLADEQVILEDPLSSSKTLSSIKILDDTYIFGDQLFNDKSTKDEPRKQNVEAEVVSIVKSFT
nr:histone deacetylase 14 [Tanacetum cinerariifolium]